MANKECIEREAAIEAVCEDCNKLFPEESCEPSDCTIMQMLRSIPAVDVSPTLWTDDPIIGTEFMTHNQGQSGFEIHFRTDDKAKYEAVQAECRRQLGHEKPASDTQPVVRGRWKQVGSIIPMFECDQCHAITLGGNFCPSCGANMEV